jgi:nitrogen fixation protein FixH
MSKQPRVLVGIDMHSYGGQRTENVFATADKFLRKCAEHEKLKRSNLQVSLRTNSQHVISFVFLPLD